MEETKHKTLTLSDKIKLLGEIEHTRAHLVRSAHVATDEEQKFWYQVKAEQAKQLRRKIQAKWLNTGELDWCLVKVSARLKWLNEEVLSSDLELFSEVESFADDILGHSLGEDLSGCESCREEIDDPKFEYPKRKVTLNIVSKHNATEKSDVSEM